MSEATLEGIAANLQAMQDHLAQQHGQIHALASRLEEQALASSEQARAIAAMQHGHVQHPEVQPIEQVQASTSGGADGAGGAGEAHTDFGHVADSLMRVANSLDQTSRRSQETVSRQQFGKVTFNGVKAHDQAALGTWLNNTLTVYHQDEPSREILYVLSGMIDEHDSKGKVPSELTHFMEQRQQYAIRNAAGAAMSAAEISPAHDGQMSAEAQRRNKAHYAPMVQSFQQTVKSPYFNWAEEKNATNCEPTVLNLLFYVWKMTLVPRGDVIEEAARHLSKLCKTFPTRQDSLEKHDAWHARCREFVQEQGRLQITYLEWITLSLANSIQGDGSDTFRGEMFEFLQSSVDKTDAAILDQLALVFTKLRNTRTTAAPSAVPRPPAVLTTLGAPQQPKQKCSYRAYRDILPTLVTKTQTHHRFEVNRKGATNMEVAKAKRRKRLKLKRSPIWPLHLKMRGLICRL